MVKVNLNSLVGKVQGILDFNNSDLSVLKELVGKNEDIDELLAKHKNTPSEILKEVYEVNRNMEIKIDFLLAKNENTPNDILNKLTNNEDKYVSKEANNTILNIHNKKPLENDLEFN